MSIQLNTRVSQRTRQQVDDLRQRHGYSVRDVVTIAIDRFYREESKMASKKIADNLDRGLWVYYGHPADDYSAAAWRGDPMDEKPYCLSLHKSDMPAFDSRCFSTVEELGAAMREIEPDLRKWKLAD